MSGTIGASDMSFLATMSPDQLSDFFGDLVQESAKEDVKSNQARRAQAILGWIATTLGKVKDNLEAAKEDAAANNDKASGSFWGSLIGILIAIVIVIVLVVMAVAGVFTGGVTTAAAVCIAAALLAGGASAAGGGALGGAIGAKEAQDNEKQAAALKALADQLGLTADELMKLIEDLKSMVENSKEIFDQISEDARAREKNENDIILK